MCRIRFARCPLTSLRFDPREELQLDFVSSTRMPSSSLKGVLACCGANVWRWPFDEAVLQGVRERITVDHVLERLGLAGLLDRGRGGQPVPMIGSVR